MTPPFIFATSCTEPDEEFSSVHTLARAIVAKRDRMPGEAGRALPNLIQAMGSRGGAPTMSMVAVRVQDGAHDGRGTLLGYAMGPGADLLARLRQALVDVSARVN